MTREEISQEVQELQGENFLLELSTGTGKTKIAIDKLKSVHNGNRKVLIVVPRNVLKDTWKEEIKKWWKKCPLDITYSTYASLHKYAGQWWWAVIYDECHHISERCQEFIPEIRSDYNILCSATVKKSQKYVFKGLFSPLVIYSKALRETIEDGILPDPKVYLIPLILGNAPTEYIYKNKGKKGTVVQCNWSKRWDTIRKVRNNPIMIRCTELQYYSDLDSQINYWKRRAMMGNKIAENRWLHLCGERLKWLSSKKTGYVMKILGHLRDYRTLTFCNNIEQTESVGSYCINSKNKDSAKYLEWFNKGKINHISACNVLNEGANLENCQIGIYANLNSSEIIVKQRTGRILRHENPIIIIPYFINTRDEELVNKMKENYNPDLIKVIKNVEEIKI